MVGNAEGTHLSPFERALGRYIMTRYPALLSSLEELATATTTHEAYFMSESGTGWPEETTIVYQLFNTQLRKDNTYGISTRKREVGVNLSDPMEFMRTLLDDYSDGNFDPAYLAELHAPAPR